MKVFSKFLVILFLLSLTALTACGGDDDDDDSGDDDLLDDDTGDDDSDDDTGDDDTSDDDTTTDDDTGDDDTGDDDTGDDDTTDDDTADDDTADDDTADDDTADDDTADDDTSTDLFDIDFEDYSLGDLPNPPWSFMFENGASTAQVVSLKDGSGKALQLYGGTVYNTDYLSADLTFDSEVTQSMNISWDEYHVAGSNHAVHGWRLFQNYSGQLYTEMQFSGDPTTGDFYAYDIDVGDYVTCATFADGTWYTILVEVDWDAATVSVSVDGTPSANCTDLAMYWGDDTPLSTMSFIDWSDDGYGGTTNFDNLVGTLL